MRGAPTLALLLLAAAAPNVASAARDSSLRSSLVTMDGTVRAVSELAGEGDMLVVTISLAPDDDAGKEIEVLLAPAKALADTGFAVAAGDRCRVRIFADDKGPAKAHKILNMTRGTMVRVRTLHQVPLWDGTGTWQGGPCGHGPQGGRGARHRGGR
jgi:hypothetical protein